MFDIHIFTLYSLNQTSLKKVEKRGNGKGHGSQGDKCQSTRRWHGNREGTCRKTSEHGRHTMTSHTLVWGFCCIFNFLPVPSALHLPPGPTASIKKE